MLKKKLLPKLWLFVGKAGRSIGEPIWSLRVGEVKGGGEGEEENENEIVWGEGNSYDMDYVVSIGERRLKSWVAE